MAKVVSAEESVRAITDGATVTVSSSSGLCCPDAILGALGERFAVSGAPSRLTMIHPLAAGDVYGIGGIDHLARPGMIRRVIAGSYPSGPSRGPEPAIWRMIRQNEVEAYNLPGGVIYDLHREAARTRLGTLTRIGLKTFCDPRLQGCRMNEAAKDDVVSVVDFQGGEWLYYHPIHPTVAIIRGTTADSRGNISMEHEGAYLGGREQAIAVRNRGGLVIAQVERLDDSGSRPIRDVYIPGHLIDLIVVAPDQMQTTQTQYDPAISGQARRPIESVERLAWGIDKVIARRIARELKPGEVVNVGFGTSANVPRVLLEAGQHEEVTWITEQGATGGLPLTDFQFGCALNPDAIMPWSAQFPILQGGGANRSLLSFLQVDRAGNVNTTYLGSCRHVTAGAGGFVDITSATKNLVFSGRFDAGGGEVEARDGKLVIHKHGKLPKLVEAVDQVSFSGEMGRERGQSVALITERCVMRFTERGWRLAEVAPGIDVRRDVIERIVFPVEVPDTVPLMDATLFEDRAFLPLAA